MRSMACNYVRQHLEVLINEITEIHEPVRIQGQKEGDVLNLDIYKFKELN